MEVSGRIKMIDETKAFGANGFRKREMVVTTDEQYPQHIMIEFTQDKCDLLNNYMAGEPVKVSINLRGREWVNPQGETKYFNSIQGWRIEKMQAEAPAGAPAQQYQQQAPAPQSYDSFQPATNFKEEEHDDLPF
ncbi:DUF3127 domain-containing protein [Flavobacterium sp.]|uniref:DUF3127 domain-containing protein n=1 Tax=Flavobacterium sp. TaxID=239 RepID=UPI004034CAF0